MVHVVARHATHVASVVLAALPVKMTTIGRVTLKARCVCPSSLLWGLQFGRIIYIRGGDALFSVLDVLCAFAVAGFACRRARVVQEFRALAVGFQKEGIHIRPVARNTLIADCRLPNNTLGRLRVGVGFGGLRLGSWPSDRLRLGRRRIQENRYDTDKGYNNYQADESPDND